MLSEYVDPVFGSLLRGVVHPDCAPEEPLPDVGCARARSAQIGGPDNISQCLQVSAYSGEPFPSSLTRNLLANDCWRSALFDKLVENGPQVSFIFMSSLFTGLRKWLARKRRSPHGSELRHPGKLQRVRPATDACEEVALRVPLQIFRAYVCNAAGIDMTVR